MHDKMGLEKIKEEILQKARSAEKEILQEAESKAAGVKSRAKERINQLEQEASKKLEADSRALESRESSLMAMESQRMVFEVKKDAIDNAYSVAFERIKDMPAKDREEFVKKLLALAQREIDVGIVHASPKDRKYLDAKALEAPLDGGIICETKDGSVCVNLTFGSLFSDLREKTSAEVSKILFG